MFKTSFNRPHEITITHGYYCTDVYDCDCGYKCKYRNNYKFHNWRVRVHRFFERRLHIKLPYFLYICKERARLSGTTKCPYGKSRLYTCWQCKYCDGDPDGVCLNPKKATMSIEELKFDDPEWGTYNRCSLFEKNEWADRYDKNTGETNYNLYL